MMSLKEEKGFLPQELRAFVLALGRQLLPEAHGMPGFDEGSVARFERQLEDLGEGLAPNLLRALGLVRLRAGILGGGMNARRERRLARALRALSQGSALERQVIKSLAVVLKISHCDSAQVYEAAGIEYVRGGVPSKVRRKPDGVVSLEELQALSELTVDAVVVGSGAGGAVMAYELARAGFVVLVVEEGDFFGRGAFDRSAASASRNLYRNKGVSFTLGNPPIYLPTGRTVGGTTTINSGTCYRPPGRVLAKWQGMGLARWGEEQLAPHVDAVEEMLRVERASWDYLGGCAEVIARGCDVLGYAHGPLRRNAPECDGQGVCAFGCPTDAKLSTNTSYIPQALRNGAYLTPGTKLLQVIHHREQVRGVLLEHLATGTRVKVACKLLVLSTGSLSTPLLLRGMGVRHQALGRNLSIHPVASVVAEFDREIRGDLAIPQGYAIEEFRDQGMLFEGGFVPLEIFAGSSYLYGDALQEQLSRFTHLANFGFMVEDEGNGRVLGEHGDMPLVHYRLGEKERERLCRGMEILAGVYLAAGAKRVWPQIQSDLVLRDWEDLRTFGAMKLKPSMMELSAYHPLGSARMAASEQDGVVDAKGRVFGWDNLYVADGAILPTSTAVNPQITIMAASSYIASMLCEEHKRLGISL